MGARVRAWAWWLVVGAVVGARELDPAACSARFDVQRDKIIRTEESREMGARYLSELDVGSGARAECIRLCCETDACDVFVYDEKGPGSCYLFTCGPPEDFRCKFVAHSNFSSGVLALSRRLAELQDAEQRAQLASLRTAASTSTTTTTSTSTSAAPPARARAPPPAPPPPDPLTPHAPRRCNRYQFECRRGGECIAVYNACDGVPQCADGSDEAPELGCPPPAPPTPGTPPPAPPGTPPPAPLGDAVERWPYRLALAQPPAPRRYAAEGAGGSHIFSHKGGLLQEAEGGAGAGGYAPFEPPAAWPRRTWPQHQPGLESFGAWGGGAGSGGGAWGGAGGEYAREWNEPRRAWPVPSRLDPEMAVYIPAKTMPEVGVPFTSGSGSGQATATLRDSAKKGPSPVPAAAAAAPRASAPEPRPATPAPPPPPPPPSPSHAAPALDLHAHDKHSGGGGGGGGAAAERHLAAAAGDEHDGLSERPPAAVLLLVLGVGLTAALGGTLACRARAARRRLRRGKPLAHDADYLVNGMYL